MLSGLGGSVGNQSMSSMIPGAMDKLKGMFVSKQENKQIAENEKYCTNFTKKVNGFVLKSKKNIDKSVKSYI